MIDLISFKGRASIETRDPICCVFLRPLSRFRIVNLERLWRTLAFDLDHATLNRLGRGNIAARIAEERIAEVNRLAVRWRMDEDLCLS